MNKTTLNSQKEKHSMLSLRRVTVVKSATRKRQAFLSTLSLRRTTRYFRPHRECASISIHALLAESDRRPGRYLLLSQISIHALLAENDSLLSPAPGVRFYFYPRSPCGERPATWALSAFISNFYPRSPCGERQYSRPSARQHHHFYPRSPCGERLLYCDDLVSGIEISIHALLAESDMGNKRYWLAAHLFLSTLSLRRATNEVLSLVHVSVISIHALLAESDRYAALTPPESSAFLSTLSLRRATVYPIASQSSRHPFLSTLSLRRATLQ